MAFETPILFLIFNRADTTKKVFERIREIKPKYLFVAADGSRDSKVNEELLCEATRKIIDEGVDWDCKVEKLYRTKNLGCGVAVSEAINWFFSFVEQGIILEDDTLPDLSFFSYCEKLLNFYKDNEKIMHISGSDYANAGKNGSYYFTKLPFIWGWATWKRAWLKYDFNLKYSAPGEKREILEKAFDNVEIVNFWYETLKDFHLTPRSFTWDYQWFLSLWLHEGIVIQPAVNVVKNIGFGENATHTISSNHHLSGVEAQRIGEIRFKDKIEINATLQNENFHFYFENVKSAGTTFSAKSLSMMVYSIPKKIKYTIGKYIYKFLTNYSDRNLFLENIGELKNGFHLSTIGKNCKLSPVYKIYNSSVGDFTYISKNAIISNTVIGKFCSIGPNLISGWGIHPTNGISTAPMFYSTMKQNGVTLSSADNITETKPNKIGNDVFIGMNVTILDGIKIGDGAVIGAGAVVSKDIPPYAIAVGNPIRILKYRFSEEQIQQLLKIKWWDFEEKDLPDVEKYFFDIDAFINKYARS